VLDVLYPASSGDRPDLAPAWAVVELAVYSDERLRRSGWSGEGGDDDCDYCGERDVIWARWCPVSLSLSSEEACVRGHTHRQAGRRGARVDDRRRADAAAHRAQEMAGGSLNVCHRQRGRGEGGQWLAVEGGRYHVQGSYNVVRAGGLMSRLVGCANGSGWRR
jgi:hypothetical protein